MGPNERAREEWRERTDGFERVRATVERTREPATASEIGDRALVSEKTARKYLDRLVDLGVATAETDGRTTRYARDADALVARRVRELRRGHTDAELLDAIEDVRAEIERYREHHGVDSPEELAALLDPGTADDAWRDLSEWRTAERNLALAQAAVSFGRAADRVEV